MSGICGIWNLDDAPADQARIRNLVEALASRGPDGSETWIEGSLALGHNHLWSTPESEQEVLPWRHAESGCVITADARLDNRTELLSALNLPAASDSVVADGTLILYAYLRWGADCAVQLLGDFAFAIWDAQRHRLFCARDPLGARPLYYVASDQRFAFASDPEALLTLPKVSAAPNEERVVALLEPHLFVRGDRRTWHQEIRAVWAGEWLSIDGRNPIRTCRHGELQPAHFPDTLTIQEGVDGFTEVFQAAIRDRLRARGMPALMMSGGLDSAAIIAMARKNISAFPGLIDTFSVVSSDRDVEQETLAIRSMASLDGVEPHLLDISAGAHGVLLDDLRAIAWDGAHPVDNSILLPALMFQAAGRAGHRLMLHGANGDVALSAPKHYLVPLLRAGDLSRAWRECSAAAQHHVAWTSSSRARILVKNFYHAFVPLRFRHRVSQWRRNRQDGGKSLLNPDLSRRVGLAEKAPDLAGSSFFVEQQGGPDAEAVSEMVLYGMSAFGRVAARFGVEAVDPWADRRVLEFLLGLPLDLKVRDGRTKFPVRAAFRDELGPEVLQRRDKQHLGWKLVVLLMQGSHDRVKLHFSEDLHFIEPYVDLDRARALLREYERSGSTELGHDLFDLLSLIAWLKRVHC